MMTVASRLWLMSLQACPLILIVLIARVLLKKYPKVLSYSLWVLVGLRLLCPVFVESSFSLQPDYEKVSEVVWEQKDTTQNVPQEIKQENRAEDELIQTDGSSTENTREGTKQDDTQNSIGDKVQTEAAVQENNQKVPRYVQGSDFVGAGSIIAIIYLSGIVVLSGSYLVRYLLMKKKLRMAVKKEENVWLCDRIQSPFVMGMLRPKIFLPYELGEREEQYILLHEKTHIRHHDSLIRGIGILCLCLHWWNPLVWLAVHCMNKDMEMFCDEAALKDRTAEERKTYAETLLHFAVRQSGFSMGLAFGESNAEQRIRNILKKKKRSRWILGTVVTATLLCTVAFLTIPTRETWGENGSGNGMKSPGPTVAEEADNTLAPTQKVQKKHAHVFDRNDVILTKPVPDYYTLDRLMEAGTVRTIKGILPGAASGTWYIAENRGVVYYFGCLEGESPEKAELYSYAIFSEDYPLANGIQVGMGKEEILGRYPDMAVVEFDGESYPESLEWYLSFDYAAYPRSYAGEDSNLNYQGKESWRWHDQFDSCLLAEIEAETRQGRDMALALMMRNGRVEAITFYCINDGTVTPADWSIGILTPWERGKAEYFVVEANSNLLEKEQTIGSKEEQTLEWYRQWLVDNAQLLGTKFAVCDVDFDGKDEIIFRVWGPNDDDELFAYSESSHIWEFDSETGILHQELSAPASLGLKVFENGIVASSSTHNHSNAAQDGRELWPYTLYQYNAANDTYEFLAEVSAWDKYYHSYEFPEEADLDGDGLVYCFTSDGNWQDNAAYETWFKGNFNGVAEVVVPYWELSTLCE